MDRVSTVNSFISLMFVNVEYYVVCIVRMYDTKYDTFLLLYTGQMMVGARSHQKRKIRKNLDL